MNNAGLIVSGFLVLILVQPVFGQNTTQASPVSQEKAVNAGNNICPVTGGTIPKDSNVTYEYKGVIYNFCCSDCVNAFKKDPEKYIKKVQEEADSQKK
jgi:YHS domain-containing protein